MRVVREVVLIEFILWYCNTLYNDNCCCQIWYLIFGELIKIANTGNKFWWIKLCTPNMWACFALYFTKLSFITWQPVNQSKMVNVSPHILKWEPSLCMINACCLWFILTKLFSIYHGWWLVTTYSISTTWWIMPIQSEPLPTTSQIGCFIKVCYHVHYC